MIITDKNIKPQIIKLSDENDFKKNTKRKLDKTDERENDSEPEVKKTKKEDFDEAISRRKGNKHRLEANAEENNCESNKSNSQDENEGLPEVTMKKKKNRKKKKSLKAKYVKDIKMFGLQILSK